MNQRCKVCEEPAAGFHFGAFTCEGCKSFFGRAHTNPAASATIECKTGGGQCVIDKKNRTSCKACRLKKCLAAGMSKSGSRYGRRSNWFKIHCLLQQQQLPRDSFNKDDTKLPISLPAPLPLFFGFAPNGWAPLPRSENSAFRETVKPAVDEDDGDQPIDLTIVRQLADDDDNNNVMSTKENRNDAARRERRKYDNAVTAAVPLDLTGAGQPRKSGICGS